MKYRNLLFALMVFVFGACQNNEIEDKPVLPTKGKNFNFYSSDAMYKQGEKERSETYSDKFDVVSVKREGDNLQIEVAYKGGCEKNSFEVIWDGMIRESDPVQINLIVKREATDCKDSGKTLKEVLDLDLVKLIGKDALQPAVFTVLNGSKESKPGPTDPNEPDSNGRTVCETV